MRSARVRESCWRASPSATAPMGCASTRSPAVIPWDIREYSARQLDSHLSFIFSGIVSDMHVLVVEDEIKMAVLIRRGLNDHGLTADVALTGEQATKMAEGSSYDAIVLDVILPGIDGFETCRRLRRDGVWAPGLMLTARGAVEDRVAGLDGGADDYLPKPFSFSE